MKFTQATENGRPDKGLSPARSEEQVTQDKKDAEATGDITFTSIRDLVSHADTQGEQVAYEFLEVANILDEQSRHKVGDPNYEGPSDLSFTMHNYYEQLLGVRVHLEEHGVLLQPPSSLLAAPAQHPIVAEAERWWTTTWRQIQALPTHPQGGHILETTKKSTRHTLRPPPKQSTAKLRRPNNAHKLSGINKHRRHP